MLAAGYRLVKTYFSAYVIKCANNMLFTTYS